MLYVAWVVLYRNRHIGASERRQLIPHVRFQVPFLGPESQLKSGFACAGLLCIQYAANLAELAYGGFEVSDPLGWDIMDTLMWRSCLPEEL